MPTAKRQTAHNNMAYYLHENINTNPMNTVVGVFARNPTDLIQLGQLYFSEKMLELERHVPPMLFDNKMLNSTLNSKRLKIGIVRSMDASAGLCPSALRALDEAEAHLKSLGHEVVEVEIPDIEAQINNHLSLTMNQISNLLNDCWSKN